MESNPLFTVVIPTKDRASYLYQTLRTCMEQEYENFEVIVSDDGSTDHTREVVLDAARRDPRIRYFSPGEGGVGMLENFERALDQVRPGYVLALGGDDGLLPGGIAGMREVIRDTQMPLLAWPAAIYTYPGVRTPNGQLMIYHARGTRIVESNQFLHRQAKDLDYLSDIESPMFYVKGVASTVLVDRVRARSKEKRFYMCPTPDGYSGIVLAGETPRFAFSGRPFAMHGVSPSSQGLAHTSNGPRAKESSAAFLRSVATRPMHASLAAQPYSPLISLMTADYLLTARDLPGWPGDIPPLDFRAVLLRALAELGHGLFGTERVGRELGILEAISAQHGLRDFFLEQVARSRRSAPRKPFAGTGVNAHAWFVDGQAYGLRNILDAVYATRHLYQAYIDLHPAKIWHALQASVAYRMRALEKNTHFPAEETWVRE